MACGCGGSGGPQTGGPLLSGVIDGIPGGNALTQSTSSQSDEGGPVEASLFGGFSNLPWWAKVVLVASVIGGVAYVAHEHFKERK